MDMQSQIWALLQFQVDTGQISTELQKKYESITLSEITQKVYNTNETNAAKELYDKIHAKDSVKTLYEKIIFNMPKEVLAFFFFLVNEKNARDAK
jgi:hypothetical protein